MKKLRTYILLLSIALLLFPKLALAQSFSVDLKNIRLNPGERVVGFDLKITSGYVSMIKTPPGWQIHVDNQPSENVEVSGSVWIGAAALYCENLNGLITITQVSNPGQTLKLTGDILVTEDFEHTRTLMLTSENIALESAKR